MSFRTYDFNLINASCRVLTFFKVKIFKVEFIKDKTKIQIFI